MRDPPRLGRRGELEPADLAQQLDDSPKIAGTAAYVALEQARHQRDERRLDVGARLGNELDGLEQHPAHDLGDAVAARSARTREALVEDEADRPHVDAVVDVGIREQLLRRHVRGRAQRAPGLRQAIAVEGVDVLRDPEIDEHPGPIADQDVRWLHVAVDDAERVGGRERRGDRREDPRGSCRVEAPLAGQHLVQPLPLDELHDEGELPARLLDDLLDRHERGVSDASGQPRFTLQPQPRGRVPAGAEQLQRDRAARRGVRRPPNVRRGAAAEQALQAISAPDEVPCVHH